MADTLRKVLDIQLNYNDAVKRMAELRQALDDVAKAEAKLSTNRKHMTDEEYNRNVSMLAESTKHYRQELNTLSKEVQNEITNNTAKVDSIRQLTASLEKLKSEYVALSAAERADPTKGGAKLTEMQSLASRIREATAPMKNFASITNAASDSIEAMKARIRQLTLEYNQLSEAERNDKSIGGAKLAEMATLSQAVDKETKLIDASRKGFKQYEDSVVALRAKLRELTADFDRLSKAQREGDDGKKLIADIRRINKELKEAEQSTGRFSRNVGNYTNSMIKGFKQLFIQVGLGFTTIGQFFVGIGNAIKDGVTTVLEFNREVSRLSSILQTTTEGVSALTAQAKQLGATTRYTAKEVIQLQTELAKLGYQQSQIVNMTESVLYFAQATGTDLASAAGVAGAALRIFGADSTQTAKYVDMMSAATAKSALNFEYIKTALPIVGGAADMFGFSLQDTLTLLSQLANSGMEASMAATATRNIFLKLADSNGKLAQALGKPVKNLNDLLNGLAELRAKGADLNDALELTNVRAAVSFTRFLNTTDAARKFSEQLNWTGMSAEDLKHKADELGMTVEELKKQMTDCTGTAEQMAYTMENNLGGDITRLKSAWDDFMISLQKGQGPLRTATGWLLKIVNYLGKIARSAEESIETAANKATEAYIGGETFQMFTEADMQQYQIQLEYYKSKGKTLAKAMELAQSDVITEIDRESEQLKKKVDAAQMGVDVIKAIDPFWSEKNNDELQEALESAKGRVDWVGSLGEGARKTILEIERVIEARQKLAAAQAELNAQTTRAEKFSNAANKYDPTGLGTESDKEIKARLQGEKQAMKKLIDALKVYNNSVLSVTRKGDDAVLKELADFNEERLTKDREAAEKQLAALDQKYQEEINQMKYKIQVDLVPRPKATPKEIAQLNEAIDVYQKAITNKEKEWHIERNRILWRLAIEEVDRMNSLRSAQLENIGFVEKEDTTRIKEKYRLRKEIIDSEEQKELNQLEIDASNDARIEEQKEALKLEILNKYRRQRLDLIRDENNESNNLVLSNLRTLRSKLVKESDKAKIDEQIAYAELGNIEANGRDVANGETEIEYAERLAEARLKAAEATDRYKDSVMKDNLTLLESQRQYYRGTTRNLQQEKQRREDEYNQLVERGKLMTQWSAEFQKELNEAKANMLDAQYDLSMHLVDSATQAVSAFSTLFSTLSDGIEQNMEDNEEWIKTAKKLSLASIYLAQGVAIAESIKNATKDPSSFTILTMAANIATAVATVVAATMQARKAIQQAQFAKGAVNIQGPGTTTSDSIEARISRGESVMTAKATEMFGGLLVIMNKIASQPSVTLPTQYTRYNPALTSANQNSNAEAMKEAVKDIHPVVSVTEITSVSNRVKAIQTLDSF